MWFAIFVTSSSFLPQEQMLVPGLSGLLVGVLDWQLHWLSLDLEQPLKEAKKKIINHQLPDVELDEFQKKSRDENLPRRMTDCNN